MVQINFALKEVNCKIVYYGPGMSGKTTNLEVVHQKAPDQHKGELTSIATEGDRTLFFDFLPLDLGQVAGMRTRFQLYTVPGQVYYNSTRKLVLQGADGIIFVADSQDGKLEENIESLKNLRDNLVEFGMDIKTIPVVLQYNKRDLPNIMGVAEMDAKLNPLKWATYEASAITGEGVFPTLKKLASIVLESLNKDRHVRPPTRPVPQPATAAPAQKPPARPPTRRPVPAGQRPPGLPGAPAPQRPPGMRPPTSPMPVGQQPPGSPGAPTPQRPPGMHPPTRPVAPGQKPPGAPIPQRPPGAAPRRPPGPPQPARPLYQQPAPEPKKKGCFSRVIILAILLAAIMAASFGGLFG